MRVAIWLLHPSCTTLEGGLTLEPLAAARGSAA